MKLPSCISTLLLTLSLSGSLAAAEARLDFHKGERIAFVGNALAERMNLFGHFETLLHARFPAHQLVVRNFGWPTDEVGYQQRPNDYTKIDDPLEIFGAETFFCFFGFNESYQGPAGVEKYKADYEKYLNETSEKYAKDKKGRFVLVSPIAFENTGDSVMPDGVKENANLKLYADATAEVAKKRGLVFVDLYAPTAKTFAAEPGAQYTINGIHINEAGDRAVGEILDRELFGSPSPIRVGSPAFEKLRAAVNDKSWIHQQDYRMLNGWYVYGGRRTYDTETFPREFKKIRNMADVRDEFIWNMATGKSTATAPDDTKTGELIIPKTMFGQRTYSEPKELRYLSGDESLKAMTPAPGYQVSLFASEEKFPVLAKPVQINFDNKGRLWASCMPSYPQWRPGDPKPHDPLLIFEDSNHDGHADKVKVFYDQLQCPTGFEFWNGGVLVVNQPRILFLKDTNGDDKADVVQEWTDGWSTSDTHHTVGAWEWSNGGLLHMLEGVSMSTTVETPWGPFRNRNTPGAYVVDPRTQRIRHFITPGYGNPWCYVFNDWGQGIVGDGTTAQQHWDTPLSGSQVGSRKGLNPVFNNESMRPAIGSDFILSRHFPDDVQGQFLYACVINMNGIPRFEIKDDGSGYNGKRIADLLTSTDRNFRPADPQIGPDGALWFADWHNPLIGHMQYSQRDPNRDHTHGRIYRLTAVGRPLLKPVTQYGKSVNELLDQLKEYEPRTRYRARRELRDRPAKDVLAGIKKWVAGLNTSDPRYDHHLTEALYVEQGHHAVDPAFLGQVLQVKTPEARAAAMHILADEWEYVPNAMALLRPLVNDPAPRVRLEAIRALSFVESPEAVELALQAARHPLDYYLDYTLQHTLGALEYIWKPLLQNGALAKDNPEGLDYLKAYTSGRPQLGAAQQHLKFLLNASDIKPEQRDKSIEIVASARGKAEGGKEVFNRICVACHRVKDVGADFGPELTKVAERLKRTDIVDSILYPNDKVEPQWLTTNITTKNGDELTGVVSIENDDSITLKIGATQTQVIKKSDISKREALKVSSMPEGLGQTMSSQEFVDLVEYLSSLK